MVPQSRWVFRREGPGKSWQCRCARGTVQKWELPALVFGMNNCGSLKAFKNRLGKSNMLLCPQPQNMDVVIRFYMLYMFIWLWAEGISIVIEKYLHGYPLCPIIVPYVHEWTLLSELVDKKIPQIHSQSLNQNVSHQFDTKFIVIRSIVLVLSGRPLPYIF